MKQLEYDMQKKKNLDYWLSYLDQDVGQWRRLTSKK